MLRDEKNFGGGASKFLLAWQMNKFDERGLSTAHVANVKLEWWFWTFQWTVVIRSAFILDHFLIFCGFLGNGNWRKNYSKKAHIKTCFLTIKRTFQMHNSIFVSSTNFITLSFISRKHAWLGCVIKSGCHLSASNLEFIINSNWKAERGSHFHLSEIKCE